MPPMKRPQIIEELKGEADLARNGARKAREEATYWGTIGMSGTAAEFKGRAYAFDNMADCLSDLIKRIEGGA